MTREYTNRLVNMLDEGVIDAKQLAESLLSWCSEDSVKEFYRVYEYDSLNGEEDEEDEDDE